MILLAQKEKKTIETPSHLLPHLEKHNKTWNNKTEQTKANHKNEEMEIIHETRRGKRRQEGK